MGNMHFNVQWFYSMQLYITIVLCTLSTDLVKITSDCYLSWDLLMQCQILVHLALVWHTTIINDHFWTYWKVGTLLNYIPALFLQTNTDVLNMYFSLGEISNVQLRLPSKLSIMDTSLGTPVQPTAIQYTCHEVYFYDAYHFLFCCYFNKLWPPLLVVLFCSLFRGVSNMLPPLMYRSENTEYHDIMFCDTVSILN